MADYEIDWATANADGANVISGGSGAVTATVSTPANASSGGEFVYDAARGGLYSTYPDPNDPAEISVNFSTEVSNVEFEIFDVDGSGSNWDDIVEIFAYDALGNRLDVTFSGLDGQTVTDYTIEGESALSGEPITVSIAGPVASFRVVFDNGPDDNTAGWISVGNVGFDEYVIPCFVRGANIETARGEILIENLEVGDMVRTLDHGMQPIRWIGCSTVQASGAMAPVLFRKGALGNTSDLLVSAAHRMMLHGWQTELLFDDGEMLVAAKSLVNDSTIIRQKGGSVDYFHILFDTHEIIFANGIPSESFHPGEACVGNMAKQSREEIYRLFPELAMSEVNYGPSARKTMLAHEAALLKI